MSKIQAANIYSLLGDISGIGEFLFQGAMDELELLDADDGLSAFLNEYSSLGIKPNATTITDTWSENKPNYKDSGSTVLTGSNLGNPDSALLKTLKDKGSSTVTDSYNGNKYINTWDISVTFGQGFNPFDADEVVITSFKNTSSFKGYGGTESWTTSFTGEVTLVRESDDSFSIKPGWTIYSFSDVWSDNYPGDVESGSISIQSKQGLVFDGENLTGNVDSISYTYKDNNGVNNTFTSGPLSPIQLEGLEYLLLHPRDENDPNPWTEEFSEAIKKFVLGGDDEIIAASKGSIYLEGGLGNDTYTINKFSDLANIVEYYDEGKDTVKIAFAGAKTKAMANAAQEEDGAPYFLEIPANIEQLVITGSGFFKVKFADVAGEFVMTTGDSLALVGGQPVLLAKGQTLVTVEDGADLVDALASSSSISLAEDSIIQAAQLQGSAAANITGNTADNILIGNAGNNVLDGGVGADRMEGGRGNDTYYVDDEDDVVVEEANAGTDTVIASISYGLGANVENLTLTGSGDLDGVGNELNNTLKGNDGNNTLVGGAGVDRLEGGKGDDTYVVNLVAKGVVAKTGSYANATAALEDTIVEAQNAGDQDTVQLRLDDEALIDLLNTSNKTTTLTLGANLENLDAARTGNLKLNLTGNAANNELIGNDADNVLNGGAGVDRMIGGKGNDTYVVDRLEEIGLVLEAENEGIDTVQITFAGAKSAALALAGTPFEWPDHVEKIEILGTGFFAVTVPNIAEPVVLTKGQAIELSGGGYAITSSTSYTLVDGVDTLILGGSASINATGNDVDNVLTGNAGNNVLNGGAGADRMAGGKGNDTYYVDHIDDLVIESAGEGTDKVFASISYQLTANVENLTLAELPLKMAGPAAPNDFNGTGNALNNVITGNSGNNVLDGGAGIDRLVGGKGNDTYMVDLVAKGVIAKTGSYANATVALEDTIVESANAGTDTVYLRIDTALLDAMSDSTKTTTLTLANHLENLDANLTFDLKLNLTGNAADNMLIGNAADNVLNGGAGNDFLNGGQGDDTLIGGKGADTMTGGQGRDTFKITALTDLGLGANQDVITDFNFAEDVIDLSALKSGKNVWSFNEAGATTTARNVWVEYTDATDHGDAFATVYFESNGKTGADYSIKLLGVTEGIDENSFVFA